MTSPKYIALGRYIVLCVLGIGALLMIISIFPGVTWADYDRSRGIGPLEYDLEARFDAVGFEYSISIVSPGGGVIGGMGAGNRTIEEDKLYPEVRGEVLENLGVIYDSYKEKTFEYELLMMNPPEEADIDWEGTGSPSIYLNVTLSTDLVPYWPDIWGRELTLMIGLAGSDLDTYVDEREKDNLSIKVSKATLMAKTGYDRKSDSYLEEDVKVQEKDLDIVFHDIGDVAEVTFDAGFPEGTEVAGFYASIEANLTDYWGRAERAPLSRTPNTINIRQVSISKTVSIIGIPLALPIEILSLLLLAAFMLVVVIKKRDDLVLLSCSTALAFLSPIWFLSGTWTVVDLLSSRFEGAEEGLHFGAGLMISAVGALLMAISLMFFVVHKVWKSGKEGEATGGQGTELKFRKV